VTQITIQLDDRTERALQAAARARGVTPSDIVREAIASHLQRQATPEKALDVARRTGLLGCADDLPPDLSTNRDHFEGFGGA
jgi:hypothetical protein